MPVETEEPLELLGLPEPGGVGRSVGDPGGEGERGDHAQHARRSRPPAPGGPARRNAHVRAPARSGRRPPPALASPRPGQRRASADRRGAPAGPAVSDAAAAAAASGQHGERCRGPADAQHEPVDVEARMRFEDAMPRRSASSARPRSPRHAQRRPCQRGQERRGRRRRYGLPRRQARRPQQLKVGRRSRRRTGRPTGRPGKARPPGPRRRRPAGTPPRTPMTLRTGPPKSTTLFHMSMSERPVTRARSARNAGSAATPPLSLTSALM